MVATKENEKVMRDTNGGAKDQNAGAKDQNGGAKEQNGSREMSRPTANAPVPYRRGLSSNWNQDPFRRMREEFDRMFEQFFGNWPAASDSGRQSHWGCDVQEDDSSVVVRADAPGFEPSEFDLQVHGDRLVIRASHKGESEDSQRGFHEWRQQEFSRSIMLPQGVDAQKVEANYKNGVLMVTLPKSEEFKAKRISVKG